MRAEKQLQKIVRCCARKTTEGNPGNKILVVLNEAQNL
jgi:hypothetical protein